MPTFSAVSKLRLGTVHPDLQRVCLRAVETVPFSVVCGHRGQEAQDRAFAEGKSKLRWPHGEHNQTPSRAVDLAPIPLDWSNRAAFVDMARHVLTVAADLAVSMRWGGDWNRNGRTDDEQFVDLPHFELWKA